MSAFENFKRDFETHKFSLTENIDFSKNGYSLFYTINGTKYTLFDFWQFFKDYQLEKIDGMTDYQARVVYLKRIIPQLKIVKLDHFDRFLQMQTPEELSVDVKKYADSTIAFFQAKLEDIERYLAENKRGVKGALTHRQEAIIRRYKIDAKCLPNDFIRVEIVKAHGKGREKAIDSVNPNSAGYKAIKESELKSIIPYLSDCPNAQKAAYNDLDNLS